MNAKTAVTVALALFVSSVVAQSNTSVDIGAIDIGTKNLWCNAEYESCNSLCGSVTANSCDSNNLQFTCTCANGSAPGLKYYIQTIPTFLCEQEFRNCINDNLQNSSGQAVCKSNEKANCGQLDPNKVVRPAPSSTEGSSPSSTGAANSASDTPNPTGASPTSTSSSAAAATMLALGREYGTGVIAAGVAIAMMI